MIHVPKGARGVHFTLDGREWPDDAAVLLIIEQSPDSETWSRFSIITTRARDLVGDKDDFGGGMSWPEAYFPEGNPRELFVRATATLYRTECELQPTMTYK